MNRSLKVRMKGTEQPHKVAKRHHFIRHLNQEPRQNLQRLRRRKPENGKKALRPSKLVSYTPRKKKGEAGKGENTEEKKNKKED